MLIARTPNFEIWRFYAHNTLRNYSYVIVQTASSLGVVIDPWEAEPLLKWAQSKSVKLESVLNTHGHHDHIRGNPELLAAGLSQAMVPWLNVIKTPGHTMEHVSFMLRDGGVEHFFPGDTLFQAGVGNCKNGGEPAVLYSTVETLKKHVGPATHIHPGHDYLDKNLQFSLHVDPSNVATQKCWQACQGKTTFELPEHTWQMELAINPFLRLSEASVRAGLTRLVPALLQQQLNDETVFIELRKLRDQF